MTTAYGPFGQIGRRLARAAESPASPGGRRAFRNGLAAAVGVGALAAGLASAAGASVAALRRQKLAARSIIEEAARTAASEDGTLTDGMIFDWQDIPPSGDGVYLPDRSGPRRSGPAGTAVLTVLGDSTAVGYGCSAADEVPGVFLARRAAEHWGRAVRLTTHAVVGSGAAGLKRQMLGALADAPDVVAIMVGANDVRDQVAPHRSAEQLEQVVAALVTHGIGVVVGTCPDLGVIMPIRQPLRRIAGVWSRVLAREQERAVNRAGGNPVPLARLVSPEFLGRPDLFYADGFHPSGAGYVLAAGALLPAVIDALGENAESHG